MRRKILIQFSAQVVWASKQSCEAASLKKTISRTFAAAVGVEQESFVNWKAWRETLFQTVPLSSARVFTSKMLSLETYALGLLYSVFNQSLVFRLVGWSRWSCLNRRMHFKTLEILVFLDDHQDNVSLILCGFSSPKKLFPSNINLVTSQKCGYFLLRLGKFWQVCIMCVKFAG